MDATTFDSTTIVAFGDLTGLHFGSISYSSSDSTVTLDPTSDFEPGEVVTVVLTTGIETAGGTPLDSAYLWSFSINADTAPRHHCA